MVTYQPSSGYARRERDFYETPTWVTDLLVPHIPWCVSTVWEPCCGGGAIVEALRGRGYDVYGSDVAPVGNFPAADCLKAREMSSHAAVTNPPYAWRTCPKIARHLVELARHKGAFVALLLPVGWDSAPGRRDLFADCQAFDKELVITKRIIWVDKPGAAPRGHHSWFIWDWGRDFSRRPVKRYA